MKRTKLSELIIIAVLVSMFVSTSVISPAKSSTTIHINADGSISPQDAPITSIDNVTYVFTGSVSDSIVIERDNIIVDGAGYTVQGVGSGTGIQLSERSNVTLKRIRVTAFANGLFIEDSASITIIENNLTSNLHYGIWLFYSSNCTIYGNNITLNSWSGITLENSQDNTIYENRLTNNFEGIDLSQSHNNKIFENIITNNNFGLVFFYSDDNRIHHNNFNNTNQLNYYNSQNVWDDGYPSGGNYWSNYTGTDTFNGIYQNVTSSDGIGDLPHVISEYDIDRFPLMVTINVFSMNALEDAPIKIHVVSNSSVSHFQLDENGKTITYNVEGDATAGFCRVTIPNSLIQSFWQSDYYVRVNAQPVDFANWTDTENTYLYFEYQHSEKQVVIVPEYSSTIILFMPLAVIALIVIAAKRKTVHKLEP